MLYHNTFVTDWTIQEQDVVALVASGRARWKIENENNNTLKTKGYHFEHNFGHGRQHLSSLLATLNLLAFLFHTVLGLADEHYRLIRLALPSRTHLLRRSAGPHPLFPLSQLTGTPEVQDAWPQNRPLHPRLLKSTQGKSTVDRPCCGAVVAYLTRPIASFCLVGRSL